jgi:mannose-6-phosphate isomerase-like protein (cupin superfamily)
MDIRRVVTGHSPVGKAIFVSDSKVAGYQPALMPGAEFHSLWASDGPITYPNDGSQPTSFGYFPTPGGHRFGFFTLPPAAVAETPLDPSLDLNAALADVEAHLPGLLGHMEPDNPGMHTTDTTDFEVVISGEVCLELDDGSEVLLKPGDTVVQNGTRHRWTNRGTVPAVVALFAVGANRA